MNKNYHPTVDFLYYASVIGFTIFFLNPFCIAVSLLSGICHSFMLGKKNTYVLWIFLAAALINPLLNHEGATIVFYMPSGNPFTLEAALYGISAAAVLASVILHFSCFNEIFTSDKLLYLFSRFSPSLSLMLSMTLRFVPEFKRNIKRIADAEIAAEGCENSFSARVKSGTRILSAAISQGLENSVETADSMNGRGYGLPGRTSYSTFCFDKRDMISIVCILLFAALVLAAAISGGFYFRYYPTLKIAAVTPLGISGGAAYTLLCFLPVIAGVKEEIVWKKLKSKI